MISPSRRICRPFAKLNTFDKRVHKWLDTLSRTYPRALADETKRQNEAAVKELIEALTKLFGG